LLQGWAKLVEMTESERGN